MAAPQALRIVASRPDPAIVTLPWHLPLDEWTEHVVPLPRGLSRHVVRIVRLGDRTYAVKETVEDMAFREYRLLRDLQRIPLPAVVPQGVVTGRVDVNGEPLPAALLTEHLAFSLPYRSLFQHGLSADNLPSLIDALVVLLVRLHLGGFYWGDVSLSNVLFRRAAGGFAAYLVDAETGEIRDGLSTPMREYDVQVGCENVFAELLDLQASSSLNPDFDVWEVAELIEQRYQALWNELTSEEEFSLEEMWRIQSRIERLNDLGFDVEEIDIVTDFDGDRIRIQPKVVELGHHQRELQALTGLHVEDAQARRLLNDIAAYTAHFDLGRESRALIAGRWLGEIFEPIMAMIPQEARGKLEPAEIYHEVLVHRWYLSERQGCELSIFEAARDYIENVLKHRPDELVTPVAGAAGPDTSEVPVVPDDEEDLPPIGFSAG
ncbi:DUF4032 domain-containing protein [Nocardioides agariphilus]|jgi:hypothetical protein|uniref:DUF4032 domain-containing protein n=1 Tax=Nocardioides agariphilus TaxID=433664 RepID=A0A930VPF7_9ACTN|nr:DUF4032 domain-containing protein [Nocardioides agariphilus]MBF4770402.1 DUF4032 domain-containing protein [Nocardioides agariphilus]